MLRQYLLERPGASNKRKGGVCRGMPVATSGDGRRDSGGYRDMDIPRDMRHRVGGHFEPAAMVGSG